MIACALTGPIPGNASSSSFDAVLMFTAARAVADTNSIASKSRIRFMCSPRWLACVTQGEQGAINAPCMLSVDRLAQQGARVGRHALLHRLHGRAIAGGPQPRHVGLGEALILAGELRRKRNVGDDIVV